MKDYTFTLEEMTALREACTEEYQRIKAHNPTSERGVKLLRTLESLKEQFKDDVRLFRPS